MDNKELRRAGLKVTGPRLKILNILEQAPERHMSAEDVYRSLLKLGEDVGLATVYRVLTQFEEVGLVRRQNFADGYSVFEINQGDHHDHLVCMQCGYVHEFVDDIIEKRQQEVAEQANFQMKEHSLTIYGICQSCLAK